MTPLRLHLNENTAGCSPAVLDAIRLMSRDEVGFYPDYRAVSAAAAAYFGVPPDWVLLTNGLDEGLHLAAQTATRTAPVDPRAHALIVEPAFEMYAHCAEAVGLEVVRVLSGPNLAFPDEALLEALSPATRLVYVTDPNNPTGLGLAEGLVARIARHAPDTLVCFDEAYAQFSGRTCIGPGLEGRRVVVGRTFAKAFGLAGVRAGALVAHPSTLAPIRAVAPPFSVNAVVVRALQAALEDRAYLDWYCDQAAASRQLLYDFCRAHEWPYWPSEANFVLMRPGAAASAIVEALAGAGILIRDKSTAPGCEGCIRITAGVVEHTRRCLDALEVCLAARAR
jgi:histidinol-phosphate aminotransferase